MLDKRSLSVLEYLNKQCLNCGYKVFDLAETVSALPVEYGFDKESVMECIRSLSERSYISVKYTDENEVCLSPLPKGRLVFENRIDSEIEKSATEKRYFKYSFLGAFLGGATFCAVALIVIIAARLI